jgi:hypothetical protein
MKVAAAFVALLAASGPAQLGRRHVNAVLTLASGTRQ